MSSFAINLKGNTKTNCPTTTSVKDSCPDTCPLKEKGCYAKYSFLGKFWNDLSNGKVKAALSEAELFKVIKRLPSGSVWRHNQAGDLQHNNGLLDHGHIKQLIKANKGKQGFTYTHHDYNDQYNSVIIKEANELGFTINISANNDSEADKAVAKNIGPVVTLLPIGADKVSYTSQGNKIVKCPADSNKGITCATCKLCAKSKRDYIIGFEAHGTAKKSVSIIASDKA